MQTLYQSHLRINWSMTILNLLCVYVVVWWGWYLKLNVYLIMFSSEARGTSFHYKLWYWHVSQGAQCYKLSAVAKPSRLLQFILFLDNNGQFVIQCFYLFWLVVYPFIVRGIVVPITFTCFSFNTVGNSPRSLFSISLNKLQILR